MTTICTKCYNEFRLKKNGYKVKFLNGQIEPTCWILVQRQVEDHLWLVKNLIFRKIVVMKKLIKEGDDFVACDLVNLEKAITFPF